jgi:type VI secretion system secreted protein Hcp
VAETIYLKLDGINGSVTSDKWRDQILVSSFSWGVSNNGSPAGAAPRAVVDDIIITKTIDLSSARVMQNCSVGKTIPTGTLSFFKSIGSQKAQKEYLKITLTDVFVASYEISDPGGADTVPTERISLNFAKIEYEYIPQSGSPIKIGVTPLPPLG